MTMLIRRLLGRFIPDEDGVYNAGYEYVDLGLSVYWATMNVGAKYDYEYGNTCKWGEIFVPALLKPIAWVGYIMRFLWRFLLYLITFGLLGDICSDPECWLSYRWSGIFNEYSRYTTDTKYATHPDYQTTLRLRDDAVHRSMGGDWRMPTVDEIGELLEQCSWQAVMINHTIPAYQITGPNGNSILLPKKNLWTSSLYQDNAYAFSLSLDSNYGNDRPCIVNYNRMGERYVRGVLDKAEDEGKE